MSGTPRNILLIHPNFPGQFRHLATQWAKRPDLRIVALGNTESPGIPGLRHLRYRSPDAKPGGHPYLRPMEQAVRVGQAAARVYLHLKKQGFTPDVVLAHPGWGDTLYLRDVFPDTRLIHFCEWYYNANGADVGFDPEFPSTLNDSTRIRTWNALHALNLTLCDEGISPTAWQRSMHPPIFQPRIRLLHEGIDTDHLGPDPQAQLTLPDGTRLKAGDPVITYVARNLEPYRGIHHFMRALSIVQQRHPTCHALIVGGDDVSYGQRPKDAANWREKLTRDIRLDPARTHFLGKLPYDIYRRVLQVSAAHVYLSYPFVLSWSMLEAMASGCLVIGADTAPVREVLRHGENGWRVDFFDDAAIAVRIIEVLNDPAAQEPLRRQARADMLAGYSLRQGLAGYERLLGIAPAESTNPVIDTVKTSRQQRQPSRNPIQPLNGGQPLWRKIA
jgi:glycosyltransferase involved in cell wall biosynthesis